MEISEEIEQLKKEQVEPRINRKFKCHHCRQMFDDIVNLGYIKLCKKCYKKQRQEEKKKKENYPLERSRYLIKKARGELKEANGLLLEYEKRQNEPQSSYVQ